MNHLEYATLRRALSEFRTVLGCVRSSFRKGSQHSCRHGEICFCIHRHKIMSNHRKFKNQQLFNKPNMNIENSTMQERLAHTFPPPLLNSSAAVTFLPCSAMPASQAISSRSRDIPIPPPTLWWEKSMTRTMTRLSDVEDGEDDVITRKRETDHMTLPNSKRARLSLSEMISRTNGGLTVATQSNPESR